MESPKVIKWVGGIGGGLFVFVFVTLVSSFFLRNMAPPPLDIIGGLFVPLLLGLLAGVQTCRVSVRKNVRDFRLSSGDHAKYPPGHCQKCGYNLTGNVSGRCPECGEATHFR